MNRQDYEVVQICHCFPERYEVLLDGVVIGDLYLRWGEFTVTYEGPNGDHGVVYEASPDEGFGEFVAEQRNHYINLAVAALDERHHNPAPPKNPVIENAEPVGWTRKVLSSE